ILNCHYCNFKMPAPKICPRCNSGYIKYSGSGSEKIESELSRIFPQARLALWDKQAHPELKDADIFVATSSVAKETNLDFGLVGVLSIDDSLNRVDLRSGEKAFALLTSLLGLTTNKFIIQTRIPQHYCFQALLKNTPDIFYQEELKQRKQLGFPPFRHLALVKLRGKYPERVREVSHILFEKLKAAKKVPGVKTLSVNLAQPAQLRGNHYWQVLISAANIKSLGRFLKINLKDLSHSGIIVTVDVDPL
ncbi:MAG: hypothetical protein PHG40_01530, partial [Candidatus Omnitrophica bacterium]|nr:hypothetical protein [Candidatus Omnitrophota bacterium]